ncbi:MAG: ABC transporter ATP-binding protein [Nostocoides sp.]
MTARASQGEVLLSYRNINKFFGSGADAVQAVNNVSLDLHEGEFLVLVGPSGCGKTTLLRMAAGLLSPTSGEVVFDGNPVSGINSDVAFVTQENKLFPWMTLAENVAFPLESRGTAKQERRDQAETLLATMGLTGFSDRYPHELSGGMQRRGAIARMLIYNPRVILMDEPFASLDALTKRVLQGELKRVSDEHNSSVLFVTHDLEEAITLGDRVVTFTRRPAAIKTIVSIPRIIGADGQEQPPTGDMAAQLQDELWEQLKGELND